ncbi:DUF3800 domain-containing protein [Methylobacterium sp. NPDC080182]|uniref:DUF3800 domain-containing protein n=1 Tax=Methylobacterium sp. NPDC080182 TaxID=3390590 RepID=UPI003D01143D
MWAYVDESGNTGNKIFDPNQPHYITAALISKTNFDLVNKAALLQISHKVDSDALHANELGVAKIEIIASDLHRLLKKSPSRFFFSRLEKRYLATAKVFDTYFDAGENVAVPWHVYWVKHLKLLLMFKLSHAVVTEEVASIVWDCLTASNERTSKELFVQGAEAMLGNVDRLYDARSRQLATDALTWARDNPQAFTTFVKNKVDRLLNAPNFVAFTNLLDGIEHHSKKWDRPVRQIVHDEQSQFGKTLTKWHAIISDSSRKEEQPVHFPGEERPYRFGRVLGSEFTMSTEQNSAGLQVIDVILWLFKRTLDGKEIGNRSGELLNYAMKNALQNDMSFAGVEGSLESDLNTMMSADMSREQLEFGENFVRENEARRLAAMQAAEAAGLPSAD